MAVISGWNGSDGSMGPERHVSYVTLVVGAMQRPHLNGSLMVVGGESFLAEKSPCRKRGSVATLGIQSHQNGCNFWLEWFIRINGTQGTCSTSRFGDGGHDRCSMGSKRSLEAT